MAPTQCMEKLLHKGGPCIDVMTLNICVHYYTEFKPKSRRTEVFSQNECFVRQTSWELGVSRWGMTKVMNAVFMASQRAAANCLFSGLYLRAKVALAGLSSSLSSFSLIFFNGRSHSPSSSSPEAAGDLFAFALAFVLALALAFALAFALSADLRFLAGGSSASALSSSPSASASSSADSVQPVP